MKPLFLFFSLAETSTLLPLHRAAGASWAIRLYNIYRTNDLLLKVWKTFWDYGNGSLTGTLHLSQIATVHGMEKWTALSKNLNNQ